MIKIELVDMSNIERMLAGFSQGAVERAAKVAILRTIKGAKSFAASKLKERYTLKSGEMTKEMKTRMLNDLCGQLYAKSRRPALRFFKHSPQKRPKRVTKGNPYLYSEVIRGQGGIMAHAFLGKKEIFTRAGKERYPLKTRYGPSVAEMLGKPPTSTFVMAKMQERLEIDVMHEVSALLGGFRT